MDWVLEYVFALYEQAYREFRAAFTCWLLCLAVIWCTLDYSAALRHSVLAIPATGFAINVWRAHRKIFL